MRQATISLNSEIASVYLKATPEYRKKVDYMVNRWLKNIFYRRKDSKEKLFETMNEIGREAQANGLTPEILEQILLEINRDMKNEKG
ncbi:MAG: hypothetical protein COZ59_04105 [Bacteroidetes bacterium CG_4_8_14_3_um_filter_31_14]|nr:MAG: hypothetical protein COZ59_04105 [Bacteroidetes bacterium CG_4_8_14_3_um_filter_31_14]